MADFKAVTVQDIHTENLESAWPALVQAVTNSEFMAMDLELSGLGNRKQLMALSVEDRYKNLTSTVRSRAVIAVGLSCFRRLNPSSEESGQRWISQTFDISTLCSENYTVEPGALKFLIDHGFDFNKQYAKGLPYRRGNDQAHEPEKSIRKLIGLIFTCGRPIVLHNALVDLAFLYGSFYADLPSTFDRFIADTSVIFETGMYDTKCLAEYQMRLQASFLQYIFRYSQRRNYKDSVSERRHISLLFLSPILAANIDSIKCKLRSAFTSPSDAASSGASKAFGFCHLNNACPKSHDLDDILDGEDAEIAKKSRRRRQRAERRAAAQAQGAKSEGELSDGEVSSSDDDDDDDKRSEPAAKKVFKSPEAVPSAATASTATSSQNQEQKAPSNAVQTSRPIRKWCTGSHRAGFDAFMTGFFFAWCLRQQAPKGRADGEEDLLASIAAHKNKISLSAKDTPLQLVKSHFAKTSSQHNTKWAKLTGKT